MTQYVIIGTYLSYKNGGYECEIHSYDTEEKAMEIFHDFHNRLCGGSMELNKCRQCIQNPHINKYAFKCRKYCFECTEKIENAPDEETKKELQTDRCEDCNLCDTCKECKNLNCRCDCSCEKCSYDGSFSDFRGKDVCVEIHIERERNFSIYGIRV